jgi:hypothetical protein
MGFGGKFGSPPRVGARLGGPLKLCFLAPFLKNRIGGHLRVSIGDVLTALYIFLFIFVNSKNIGAFVN